MTPRLGTDGNRIVYPVRGIVQVFHRFSAILSAERSLYVSALVVAAVVTAASLILAGYGVEAPITVCALALAAAVPSA